MPIFSISAFGHALIAAVKKLVEDNSDDLEQYVDDTTTLMLKSPLTGTTNFVFRLITFTISRVNATTIKIGTAGLMAVDNNALEDVAKGATGTAFIVSADGATVTLRSSKIPNTPFCVIAQIVYSEHSQSVVCQAEASSDLYMTFTEADGANAGDNYDLSTGSGTETIKVRVWYLTGDALGM